MYTQDIYGSLFHAQLDILNCQNAEADHAASHYGKAIGITHIIRQLKSQASRRVCLLPVQLMTKVKIFFEINLFL